MPAFIDLPDDDISGTTFVVAGWVATNAWDAAIAVRVNGKQVAFELRDRPDVRGVPELSRFSFTSGVVAEATLDGAPRDGRITVELSCDGEVMTKTLTFVGAPPRVETAVAPIPPAHQSSPLLDDLRAQSRLWCRARLRCPACHEAGRPLTELSDRIVCGTCQAEYIQDTAALNFISSELGLRANIAPTENVSSNPYTPDALALIEATVSGGGWLLDCGAGARPERMAHVVNVEIVDYPSTDVLAVGEALPFADNSFDAVLTLAVLEHVRDPFACAREIMRVLKPGGEVLADVPFLQPLHGYPHHYYNMTQQGLINLFAGMGDVLECRVPPHGHPIFGVQWLLSQYIHGLPEELRASFSQMTIGELAAVVPHEFLTGPAAYMLPAEAQNIIGCLNSLRFRKSSADGPSR